MIETNFLIIDLSPVQNFSSAFDDCARAIKDTIKHRFSQLPGEGVLLTRMKRSDERNAVAQYGFGRMSELRPTRRTIFEPYGRDRSVECKSPERYDHTKPLQQFK